MILPGRGGEVEEEERSGREQREGRGERERVGQGRERAHGGREEEERVQHEQAEERGGVGGGGRRGGGGVGEAAGFRRGGERRGGEAEGGMRGEPRRHGQPELRRVAAGHGRRRADRERTASGGCRWTGGAEAWTVDCSSLAASRYGHWFGWLD